VRFQTNAIEDRHLHHVPDDARHGAVWRQGPFWFLGNFQPLTLAIAFLGPVLGLNGLWTSVAGVAGILFGAVFMTAHAAQGPILGLPQMIQSRAQFGYRGVIVPVMATTLTFVGFNVVTVVTIKQGLFEIFHWNPNLVACVVTLVAGALAIYGHDWIHSAVIVVFFVSLPLWIVLTVGILTGHAGGHVHVIGNFNLVGFLATFAVAASYNITYAPCVSDYSRYLARATSRRRITMAVFVGAVGSPIWLIPLGAWMATRLRVSDALTGIDVAGNGTVAHLGTVLALTSVATLVVAMGISAYSGMLSVLTMVDSFRAVQPGRAVRALAVVALAVVWFILGAMLANATSVLSDWLLFMLYLLAPWTSVNLADFYFVRRGRFAISDLLTPSGVYRRWGVRGLCAYAAGIVAEIPFVAVPGLYQSPGANWLHGVDVSWLVGLVVAGTVYLYFARSLDHEGERVAIARSEKTLLESPFGNTRPSFKVQRAASSEVPR
jgi:NCS1 family nucleobase:cation symporter-1